MILLSNRLTAQTRAFNQFWNDFQLITPIYGKWGNEINIGQVWTSAPGTTNNPVHANAQLYTRIWLHYTLPKIKLSVFTGYNHNAEIIAAGQNRLPEIRSAVQAAYYFKKSPYILTGRLRIEDHQDKKESKGFDKRFRGRSQLKIVKPLNNTEIRKNTMYVVASEELFTTTAADIWRHPELGSNRITLGCGYALSSQVLVEIDYSNDFYFRESPKSFYNAVQVNFTCYNWVKNLKGVLAR